MFDIVEGWTDKRPWLILPLGFVIVIVGSTIGALIFTAVERLALGG